VKYIFLIGMVLAEVIRFPYRARAARARREGKSLAAPQVKGSESWLMTTSFLGMYVFPLAYIFSPWLDFANYTLPVWVGGLGIVCLAGSLLIIWRSHADLEQKKSADAEEEQNQGLVTNGVYHYFRHPVYTAMMLSAIAQALMLQNWIAGLVGPISFIPLFVMRVPQEEAMMLERYGDDYREYMEQTGRFFPKIFR